MSTLLNDTSAGEGKLAWTEPEVTQLDIRDTARTPLTGGDFPNHPTGIGYYPDCTRS